MLRAQLLGYMIALGYALIAAISMGLGVGLAMKIFTWMTPNIDEIQELKEGNLGVGMVLAALILSMGLVVAGAIISITLV
jgi:uncharacterized membrane protein YjfL (UPF0719 family)